MVEYVVWCLPHEHYLKHVSVTGTTWCGAEAEARRYTNVTDASIAAERATWLDHRLFVREVK